MLLQVKETLKVYTVLLITNINIKNVIFCFNYKKEKSVKGFTCQSMHAHAIYTAVLNEL